MTSKTWAHMIAMTSFAALAIPVSLAAQDNPDQQHHHYKLTVLGTLGGTFGGEGWGVNNRGSIAGHSALPNQTYHAFFWQKGVITDLGTLCLLYTSPSPRD